MDKSPVMWAALAGVMLAVILLIGCGLSRRVLFPRHLIAAVPTPVLPAAPALAPGVEQLWLQSPQGPVEAWFLPADRAETQTEPGFGESPLVVYAHGNAELIDYAAEDVEPYRRWGLNVLLVEYRGYGRSAGSPSQNAILADFTRWVDLVAARDDVDATRIIYHGRSLGGAVLAVLATERPPAALILQSGFTSVKDVARQHGLPGFLVRDPFDACAALKRLDCPVLIMHGRHDDIIPLSHGRKLHDAAPHSTFVPLDCGHNDPPPQTEYWQAIQTFLRDHALIDGP